MVKTKHTEKCTGIVQLVPENQDYLCKLQEQIIALYPEQVALPRLHITILHQAYPKLIGTGKTRGDKILKTAYKEGKQNNVQAPAVSFGDIYMATGEGDEDGRVSTYVVIPETQLCKDTRDAILSEAGLIDILGHVVGTPEQTRVFHVSLTNLTGNGGDSIKYPNLAKDVKVNV
jgi:hypothetical protein